jgi:hypothetical protein
MEDREMGDIVSAILIASAAPRNEVGVPAKLV